MAKKTIAYLLIGPDAPTTLPGMTLPDVSAEALSAAQTEILRTHHAEGLRRRDVEGAWASICRKAWKARRDLAIAVPRFADATSEQAALALDSLAGHRVYVVTFGPVDTTVWAALVKPGRVLDAGQWGCQASSSAVRDVTASGSVPAAS